MRYEDFVFVWAITSSEDFVVGVDITFGIVLLTLCSLLETGVLGGVS